MQKQSKIKNQKSKITDLLNLFYLNFRVTLTVTLSAFVLFATFFLENDDLVRASVSEDGRRNGRVAADHGVCARARNQSLDVDSFAFLFIDRRYAQGLTPFALARICSPAEK
jgi:hypothetical protein